MNIGRACTTMFIDNAANEYSDNIKLKSNHERKSAPFRIGQKKKKKKKYRSIAMNKYVHVITFMNVWFSQWNIAGTQSCVSIQCNLDCVCWFGFIAILSHMRCTLSVEFTVPSLQLVVHYCSRTKPNIDTT